MNEGKKEGTDIITKTTIREQAERAKDIIVCTNERMI